MTTIDMHTKVFATPAFQFGTHTDTTVVGNTIDTQNFESLEFFLESGSFGASASATPIVEDSPDASTWTSVDADFLLGTISDASFGALDTDQARRIGYNGKERYVRLSIVTVGTTNFLGCSAVLGHARSQPTDENVA